MTNEMQDDPGHASRAATAPHGGKDTRTLRILRIILRISVFALLLWGAHLVVSAFEAQLEGASRGVQVMVTAGLLLSYALLIAIPFVPGVELGLSLLVLKGAEAAPGVYVATVMGLLFAYCIGRFIPFRWIERVVRDVGFNGFADQLIAFRGKSMNDRLGHLQSRLPRWAGWLFGRFRYVLLAGLINLPGSSVIGGGGGILMFAGISRLFKTRYVILTLLLAVAPIPFLVWLYGGAILAGRVGA